MNERGVTLIELLVAAAIGVIVLLGLGTFYVSTIRFVRDSTAEAFLDRQGTLIMEELGRQIRPASALSIVNASTSPGTCLDAIANLAPGSNGLTVDNGTVLCFYRTNAGQLIRCQFTGGTCNSFNLLSGSLVPLTATAFDVSLITPCQAAGWTCAGGVCANPSSSCGVTPAAAISFTLSDGANAPRSFRVDLTTSRHL